MLNKKFEGILSKLANKGGDKSCTQLAIKYTQPHPDHFDQLNDIFKMANIKMLVDAPEKVKIGLSLNLNVEVEFDEVTFNAHLVDIKMTKKEKKGEILYEYEMKFEKEIEDIDNILAVEYLNRKEDNEEGKPKLVYYDVKISKKEDK